MHGLTVVCYLHVFHSGSFYSGYGMAGHWRPTMTQSDQSGSEPAPDRTCLWPLRFQRRGHDLGADWWSCRWSPSPGPQLESPDGLSDAPSHEHSTQQRYVFSCERRERGWEDIMVHILCRIIRKAYHSVAFVQNKNYIIRGWKQSIWT